MQSRRWSIIMETWVESVHHEESDRRWWGLIRRQNLGVLQRLGHQRGSKRCRRRSEVGRISGGSLLSRTSAGGYFIPNTSPPTFEFMFRMKEVQRNFHSRSYPLRFSHSVVSKYFGIWHAGAGAFSNRGDPKRFFRNFRWSVALGTVQ